MISKLYYRLNVGRSDGGTIPLGVIALLGDDVREPGFLVLLARSKLESAERSQLDWAAARLLENPFEFFKNAVDAALKERVGSDVLDRLAQRFTWSIFASPPAHVAVPAELASDLERAMEVMEAAIKGRSRGDERARKPSPELAMMPRKVPSALAHIAGPEFEEGSVRAYLPPAWMLSAAGPEQTSAR